MSIENKLLTKISKKKKSKMSPTAAGYNIKMLLTCCIVSTFSTFCIIFNILS